MSLTVYEVYGWMYSYEVSSIRASEGFYVSAEAAERRIAEIKAEKGWKKIWSYLSVRPVEVKG